MKGILGPTWVEREREREGEREIEKEKEPPLNRERKRERERERELPEATGPRKCLTAGDAGVGAVAGRGVLGFCQAAGRR